MSVSSQGPATREPLADEQHVAGSGEEFGAETTPLDDVDLTTPSDPPKQESASLAWRDQVSQKVERVRERRAHFRSELDSGASLEFDFGSLGEKRSSEGALGPATSAGPSNSEASRSAKTKSVGTAEHDSAEDSSDWLAGVTSEDEESEALPLEPALHHRPEAGPRAHDASWTDLLTSTRGALLQPAPLDLRLKAGLFDALILTGGAAVFGLIFWVAGGRLKLDRLELVVLGLIGVCSILAYFGLFAALTASTPGLLRMNLELRNLEGEPPGGTDSLLRALGYVVSVSALMLGFVWAFVDSDGLTWHDRMSGTLIVTRGKN